MLMTVHGDYNCKHLHIVKYRLHQTYKPKIKNKYIKQLKHIRLYIIINT